MAFKGTGASDRVILPAGCACFKEKYRFLSRCVSLVYQKGGRHMPKRVQMAQYVFRGGCAAINLVKEGE